MNTENQPLEQVETIEPKKLEITSEIKNDLNQAAKWSKFLAILGFVFMGLMVFGGIIMSLVMAFIPTGSSGIMPFPPLLIGIIYIVMAAIYFFPVLYLYRFSTSIKQALFLKDQNKLTKAFYNLRAHYRFIAILAIVMLCLYPLMIIGMVAAGIFGGLSHFPGMPA